jgi:hypothetical protein
LAEVDYEKDLVRHADPYITLGVYAHLYAGADHAETARATVGASYRAICDAGAQRSAAGNGAGSEDLDRNQRGPFAEPLLNCSIRAAR